jgi:anti-sigma factor RsiW
MNPEALERLVIDRASGELPPDTAALLEDYLQTVPPAAEAAARIEQTLLLAKQALASPREMTLPAPSFDRPLRVLERETAPDWRLAQMAWGMAACFVGGLLVAWLLLRAPAPTLAPAPSRQLAAVTPATSAAAPAVAAESGFWSVARLYQATLRSASPPTHSRLIWESPVKQPQINVVP